MLIIAHRMRTLESANKTVVLSVVTLVDMISGMDVKEDDPDFMNAMDYMFAGLENASRIVSL